MQLRRLNLHDYKQVKPRPPAIADSIYQTIKEDIFAFRLIPGDRFTEQEIAEKYAVSRTPVRQALFRLQQEGYVEVRFRNGWQVSPFDFKKLEALYELRIVLEIDAVRRLCQLSHENLALTLQALIDIWLVDRPYRVNNTATVSMLDESFHCGLVMAAGNAEIAKVHAEVSEKIRIIRQLDFTKAYRIEATYDEHGQILNAILNRHADEACRLIQTHIAASKAEVRKITMHILQSARK